MEDCAHHYLRYLVREDPNVTIYFDFAIEWKPFFCFQKPSESFTYWIYRPYCATHTGHVVPLKTDINSRPKLHINLFNFFTLIYFQKAH